MNDITIQIFTAKSGYESVRLIKPDGSCHHIHSLVAPEKEHEYWGTIDIWADTVILEGTGLGYHLDSSFHALSRARQIIAVDPNPEILEKFLSRLNEIIDTPIAGISADWSPNEVKNLIGSGSIQTIRHWASYVAAPAFFDSIKDHLSKPTVPRASSRQHKTLRPLLLYGNFFLEHELKQALGQITSEAPICLPYKSLGSSHSFSAALERALQVDRPDYIMSVNMKGFDGNGLLGEISERYGIPVVVWFVDDPHPILLHQAKFIRPNMIALCWEKCFLPFLSRQGFSSVHYLPLACDESTFSFCPTSPTIPLCFVGSSMHGQFLDDIRRRFLWKPELQPLVEIAATKMLEDKSVAPGPLLTAVTAQQRVQLPFDDPRNTCWLISYIVHTAGMHKRRKFLKEITDLGLHTFGDPQEWERLLGPAAGHHPPVDYRRELASIYRSSAINVNITSCQMRSAVNQRVFDIPSCGGFVLSDNQKDLGELFELGTEAVEFASGGDLREKIVFYGKHDDARGKISSRARLRIQKEHRYVHRLEEIAKLVN